MVDKKQIWIKPLLVSIAIFLIFYCGLFFFTELKLYNANIGKNLGSSFLGVKKLTDNLNFTLSIFAYPFLKLQTYIVHPINNQLEYFRNNRELVESIAKLQKKNEALQSEIISLKGQFEYYKQIKELRDFSKRYENGAKIVQVLMYVSDPDEHVLFIDSGIQDGISVDMVAVYKNCLIGRVSQVNKYWSKVTLITDKSFKIEGACSKTRTTGMVEGCHNNKDLKFSFVEHLEPVEVGDYILSTGNGLIFPAGFGLGIVRSAAIQNCTYSISVKPLVKLNEIKYCLIIQKGQYN